MARKQWVPNVSVIRRFCTKPNSGSIHISHANNWGQTLYNGLQLVVYLYILPQFFSHLWARLYPYKSCMAIKFCASPVIVSRWLIISSCLLRCQYFLALSNTYRALRMHIAKIRAFHLAYRIPKVNYNYWHVKRLLSLGYIRSYVFPEDLKFGAFIHCVPI